MMQKVHFRLTSVAQQRCCLSSLVGSFSNDDVDGKEDVKKAIGLLRKTTTSACITPFCTFLYRPSTTYDVKVPN